MRINKWHIIGTVPVLLFFGYLTYHEFFFNDTATAESAIQQSMAALPVAHGAAVPPEYYGQKRAQIALAEYNKNVVEEPRGCNCGPEIDKYTEDNPGQWCTMFVSWVAKEAGSPLVEPRTKTWRYSNSRLFTEYLQQYGTFYSRDQIVQQGLKPKLGDFVIFWRGNIEDNLGHIDIVVADGNRPGTAGLVGGNVRDHVAYRENFPYLDYYGFLGFGRLEK